MSAVDVIENGDIFASGSDAIVVPVNCLGVPGKALAKAAAQRWPAWATAYKAACAGRAGLQPGGVHVYDRIEEETDQWMPDLAPQWTIAAATKNHWRHPSQFSWVTACALKIAMWMDTQCTMTQIAVPALGCGEGGLAWGDVRPLLEMILGRTHGALVLIYAPHTRPARRPR